MTDREGSRFTIYPPYVKTLFMGIKIYKNIPVGSFGIRNELSRSKLFNLASPCIVTCNMLP